jgi:hypothetical protein
VRHHTSDEGLDGIRRDGAIRPSRGWPDDARGVHVEIEPFGTTRPTWRGRRGPKADLGIQVDGAYVEFDVPTMGRLVPYSCGPRKTALLVTDRPLHLTDLNPVFVRVRRHWWEFWRCRPEKGSLG